MKKLIISAPFGNWFRFEHATSTRGTYTAERRGWRWTFAYQVYRVLASVWYYPSIGTWKNKLGLPNAGIDHLVDNCRSMYTAGLNTFEDVSSDIISVRGHSWLEWEKVLYKAAGLLPEAIEANVSCPNCPGEDLTNYPAVFEKMQEIVEGHRHYGGTPVRLIVKLPPVGYHNLLSSALDAGITRFHCCNTIPTPAGGLSGKALKPFSLECVTSVVCMLDNRGYATGRGENVTIIGGGGITHREDVMDYIHAGATNVAVGSALFLPWNWRRIRDIANRLELGVRLLDYIQEHPISEICEKPHK